MSHGMLATSKRNETDSLLELPERNTVLPTQGFKLTRPVLEL